MTRFNLPVMGAAMGRGVEELMRLSMRAEGVFDGTLADAVNLECGTVLVSEEFPEVGAANQVREVVVEEGRTVAETVAAVEGVFALRGVRCSMWIFAGAQTPVEAVPVLEGYGYRLRRYGLWVLQSGGTLREGEGFTVIPGRASFEGVAMLGAEACGRKGVEAQFGAAAVRRLDDTQVDCLLALEGTVPVGMLYFTTNAQLGLITQFFVREAWRRRGVGSLLLSRAIELAARSRVRHVTLFCEAGNAGAEGLYRRAGFVEATTVDAMQR